MGSSLTVPRGRPLGDLVTTSLKAALYDAIGCTGDETNRRAGILVQKRGCYNERADLDENVRDSFSDGRRDSVCCANVKTVRG